MVRAHAQDLPRRRRRCPPRCTRWTRLRRALRRPRTSFNSGRASPRRGRAAVRAAGGRVADALPIINGLAVRMTPSERARLAHDPRIAAVSANAPIRSQSTRFDSIPLATAYPPSVYAPTVWNSATGAGVGVAVIDTGIDGGLVDFSDGNGGSRVVASVVTNPDATTPNDTYGHGTHVAGIIAGDGTRRVGRRSARGPLRRRRPGSQPDRDQGLRRPRPGDGPRRDLRPAVRRRPQGATTTSASSTCRCPRRSPRATAPTRSTPRSRPRTSTASSSSAAAGNRGTAADATQYSPGQRPVRDRRRRGRRPGDRGPRR